MSILQSMRGYCSRAKTRCVPEILFLMWVSECQADELRPSAPKGARQSATNQVAQKDYAAAKSTTSEPPAPFKSSVVRGPTPQQATGYFRVVQDEGVWWLVDPLGQETLSIAVDKVSHEGRHCDALGYSPYARRVSEFYGTPAAWSDEALKRLHNWGFNALGIGCSRETKHRGLAHTDDLVFGQIFKGTQIVPRGAGPGLPDVFDPAFKEHCDQRARAMCQKYRDDPWLIGYFLDNALEWTGKTYVDWGLALDAARLPKVAAAKQALASLLRREFRDDVAEFNLAFNLRLQNLSELESVQELPAPANDRAKAALQKFCQNVAAEYFEITSAAVRRYDPNHLILGCRFDHRYTPDFAWVEAGRKCDVISFNCYPRVDLVRRQTLGMIEYFNAKQPLVNKPILISEWCYPGLDAKDADGRPIRSQVGAGMRVDTQAQRADCFAIMQRDLFSIPYMIGSHFFSWIDDPALGMSKTFPEDCNYGLVSEHDAPYVQLAGAAKLINPLLADLHAKKISPADVDNASEELHTWRPRGGKLRQTLRVANQNEAVLIDTGVMRLSCASTKNRIVDAIALKRHGPQGMWNELGWFEFVVEMDMGEDRTWYAPDQRLEFRTSRKDERHVVMDVTCRHTATPAWNAVLRLTFEAGMPGFRCRCVSFENRSDQEMKLGAFLFSPMSRMAGDAQDDWPLPFVTNYWAPVWTWVDERSGLHFGVCIPQEDQRFRCRFWKTETGREHPDCRRMIGETLAAKKTWVAGEDEPDVLIFGLEQSTKAPPAWFNILKYQIPLKEREKR